MAGDPPKSSSKKPAEAKRRRAIFKHVAGHQEARPGRGHFARPLTTKPSSLALRDEIGTPNGKTRRKGIGFNRSRLLSIAHRGVRATSAKGPQYRGNSRQLDGRLPAGSCSRRPPLRVKYRCSTRLTHTPYLIDSQCRYPQGQHQISAQHLPMASNRLRMLVPRTQALGS